MDQLRDIKITGEWTSPDDTSSHRLEFAPVSKPLLAAMRNAAQPDRWILVTEDQMRTACPTVTGGRLAQVFAASG